MENKELMNGMQEVNANEVVPYEDTTGLKLQFDMESLMNVEQQFYCSIEDDGSRKSKVAIYNAISNAQEKLDDHINKELKIVDVVVHPVQIVDERTGEVSNMLRTILIDDKGIGYAAVSYGVLSALQRMFGIIGKPSWKDEPVVIIPKKETTRNGNKVTTLAIK